MKYQFKTIDGTFTFDDVGDMRRSGRFLYVYAVDDGLIAVFSATTLIAITIVPE